MIKASDWHSSKNTIVSVGKSFASFFFLFFFWAQKTLSIAEKVTCFFHIVPLLGLGLFISLFHI